MNIENNKFNENAESLLKEEKFLVCNNLDIYAERYKIAKLNRFEGKLETFKPYIYIAYFVLIAALYFGVSKTGLSQTLDAIPRFLFSSVIPITSIGVGAIIGGFYKKTFGTKKELKSFSNARKEEEVLEEEIRNKIELENYKNKNKIIRAVMRDFPEAKKNKLNIQDQSNKVEPEEEMKVLNNLLAKEYSELNVITTQKVLSQRFECVKNNFNVIRNIMIGFLGGGLVGMFSCLLPSFVFFGFGSVIPTSMSTILTMVVPYLIGSISTGSYMIKRTLVHKKVFKKLNSELQENAISLQTKEATNEHDLATFVQRENAKISSISKLKLKYCLEVDKKYSINDDNYSITIRDETKEKVLEHPQKPTIYDARLRIGKIYTEEDHERYVKESLSRPILGEEEFLVLGRRKKYSKRN